MVVVDPGPAMSGHITKGKEPQLGEVRAPVFHPSSTPSVVWVLDPWVGPEDRCVVARTLAVGYSD